jgi:YfiH family protein
MIPQGMAFSTGDDGHQRDPSNRVGLIQRSGAPNDWAEVEQVHGAIVHNAMKAGRALGADAVFTEVEGLAVAAFGGDCPPVLVSGKTAVGAAHSGWRGTAKGVVPALVTAMFDAGHTPTIAAIGPGIGPCCFEVGSEVLEQFPGFEATTSWGTPSIRLSDVIECQLGDISVVRDDRCTHCDPTLPSYRRDKTTDRLVGLAWRT